MSVKINKNQMGKNSISRMEALKYEISEHAKAVEVLINNNCNLSSSLLLSYLVELGLKYVSFLSNHTKCYRIEKREYNEKRNSNLLATGIYKFEKQNCQVEYFQVWQQLNKADKIKLLDGILEKKIYDKIEGKSIEIKTFLCDAFIEERIVSYDYLYAIFKDYSPYPQTHKIIDIFKTIGEGYQQILYNSFIFYLVDYRQKFHLDNNLTPSFVEFKSILSDLPDFVTFRYIHGGSGVVDNCGEYISSLWNALNTLIMAQDSDE